MKSKNKDYRIAVLNTHPIQYYAPMYKYINKDPEIEITAIYCSDFGLNGGIDPGFKQDFKWDIDLLDGYPSIFLDDRGTMKRSSNFFTYLQPKVWTIIRSGNFNAVWLHGYNHATFMIAWLAARTKGIPVFIRCDTHQGLHRSSLKRMLRHVALSALYKLFQGFLAVGTANREFYLSLGVSRQNIFSVPFSVDNERFIKSSELTEDEKAKLIIEYGLDNNLPTIIFAGKFIQSKHPDKLILAIQRLHSCGIYANLLMIGSGDMEEHLKKIAQSKHSENIRFTGFINQTELPKVFGLGSIFVLGAENEAWGLVVNEAMCASMSIIASKGLGCTSDLVHDGVNGAIVREGDTIDLSNKLAQLLTHPELMLSMGQASKKIIQGWSYQECKEGLKSALIKTGGKSPLIQNGGNL